MGGKQEIEGGRTGRELCERDRVLRLSAIRTKGGMRNEKQESRAKWVRKDVRGEGRER